MLEVKNIEKKYGNHYAVKNLSFHLEEGKIYGLLGPNGAGKSTTMNMITGYIAPTSGDIFINGHDLVKEPESAKACIGYLPEIPPLYIEMTVWEYLLTVCELKKVPRQEKKSMINDVMEKVKITDMKNRLIKNLSKGYKQRVGIAQALIGFPKIIILDEPTVGLDPKQIIDIRDLVKELGKDHTVIISSHILAEISAICDEIVIINKGSLIAIDTTENLMKMNLKQSVLQLSVQGDETDIRDVTAQLEGIKSIEIIRSKAEEQAYDLNIITEHGIDIRKDLFFALADSRLPILKMQSSNSSLEDIFLELTEQKKEEEE